MFLAMAEEGLRGRSPRAQAPRASAGPGDHYGKKPAPPSTEKSAELSPKPQRKGPPSGASVLGKGKTPDRDADEKNKQSNRPKGVHREPVAALQRPVGKEPGLPLPQKPKGAAPKKGKSDAELTKKKETSKADEGESKAERPREAAPAPKPKRRLGNEDAKSVGSGGGAGAGASLARALRYRYEAESILESATRRKHYSDALAKLLVSDSFAPNQRGMRELIEKAKAGKAAASR
jgi:hypothetical protein